MKCGKVSYARQLRHPLGNGQVSAFCTSVQKGARQARERLLFVNKLLTFSGPCIFDLCARNLQGSRPMKGHCCKRRKFSNVQICDKKQRNYLSNLEK